MIRYLRATLIMVCAVLCALMAVGAMALVMS